ncbi:MAG TPA: hypothetical protein VLE73_03205 [Candidatus Saccharimonadales bacterium]|nr:hypothetical protein [Candidatus Saccharimonadales bacterium]
MNNVQSFYAKDRAAWRQWLIQNHNTVSAVWLVYDKGKNRPLTYDAIVEEVQNNTSIM